MTKKFLLCLACAAATGTTALADVGQTVTVDGQQVSGFVSQMTFSGDNVVLHFENGTTQTAEFGTVKMTFNYNDVVTSVSQELNAKGEALGGPVYDLTGRKVADLTTLPGTALPKGIYIVNGKKVVIK